MASGIGGEEYRGIEVRSGIPEVRSRSGCNFGIGYHTRTFRAKSAQQAILKSLLHLKKLLRDVWDR